MVKAIIINVDTSESREGEVGCSKCNRLACVCNINRRHLDGCKFKKSATCAIPIECEHGYDVCPICDPCSCPGGITDEDFDA